MREIKCPICLSLDHTSIIQLRRHLIRQHNSYGTFPKILKCVQVYCNTELKGVSSFIRHLREQHIFENTTLDTASVSSSFFVQSNSVTESNSVEEFNIVAHSNSVVNQDNVSEGLNLSLGDITDKDLEKTNVFSDLKNKLKSEMSRMIFALLAK